MIMNEPTMQPNKTVSPRHGFSVHQIAAIGIMSAVTCILAPFSIPIGPVPISLTNLAIYFALYILGMKEGTISYLIYLLIGLIGIPVFSGFTSGPEKLFGPTGGYLIGFIPMAVIAGIIIDRFTSKRFLCLLCNGNSLASISGWHGLESRALGRGNSLYSGRFDQNASCDHDRSQNPSAAYPCKPEIGIFQILD